MVETYVSSLPGNSQEPDLAVGLLARGPVESGEWRVEFVSHRLVEPPTDLSALISAGRRMLLERGWQPVVCVTDLPLQTARRPVIAMSAPPMASRFCPCPPSARWRCASARPRRSSVWSGPYWATLCRPQARPSGATRSLLWLPRVPA